MALWQFSWMYLNILGKLLLFVLRLTGGRTGNWIWREKKLRYYMDVKIRARSHGAIFSAISALLPTKREP